VKKKLAAITGVLAMAFVLPPLPSHAAEDVSRFEIDLSQPYRPVTRVASGMLYGLAEEGRPDDRWIAPLKPKNFTQMAPGGQQLPNGETAPTGDALVVAPIADRHGATVTIRMPDIYPDFPYRWVDWNDWLAKVDAIVGARLASGADNIYAYEIWNEPNWTWDTAKAGPFFAGWKQTYDRIRMLDPDTPIMGPSITHYDENYLRDFLTYCKANQCLPDIISWHELGNPEGNHRDTPNTPHIKNHIAAYRALEQQLGIGPLPISINEYGVQVEEGVPGAMVQYFAQFERGGVDTANVAFWFRPGRLSNLITDSGEPNGGWWLFKWYGDMSGQMVMTAPNSTTSTGLDGIASIDPNLQTVHALFGGSSGTADILVKGVNAAAFLGNKVRVTVEAAPWYGVDTPVRSPLKVMEGEFDVINNEIRIRVNGMKESWGYRLTIVPAAADKTRYEAEHALIHRANLFSSPLTSNGRYVGQIDFDDSYVEYQVTVPAAGRYHLDIWYANGMGTSQQQSLSVNGGPATAVSFPATGGWLWAAPPEKLTVSVMLNGGANTIRFTKIGFVEHDCIQLSPAFYLQKWEAEDAVVHRASVFHSHLASDSRYVGQIDEPDSYVEYEVNVPASGLYTMVIRYANGTASNQAQQLAVNGNAMGPVVFPPTNGWLWAVPPGSVTMTVQLNAGNNKIRFTKDGFVEHDCLYLIRTSLFEGRWEAEQASIHRAIVFKSGYASDARFVGMIDYADSYVEFSVHVPSAGTYSMEIGYGNGTGNSSTHQLHVNGAFAGTVTYPPTGGWISAVPNFGTRKTVGLSIQLNAGTNTIRFTKGTGYAELDYIRLTSPNAF